MPAQTRSQFQREKEQAAQRALEMANDPLPTKQDEPQQCNIRQTGGLVRAGTIVQIGPSDTGLGTHIRWIRPDYAIEEDTQPIDPRYTTPVPQTPPQPVAPRKIPREPRLGGPGLYDHMEDAFVVRLDIDAPRTVVERVLAEEVNRRKLQKEATIPWEGGQIRNTPQDSVASEDVFGPSMPPGQRFVPSNNGILRDYHGRPLCSILRSPIYIRAPSVEPHGTRIQPEKNPRSIPSHPVRGLGPYGTVLLGDDGRPLVADLHPGY